MADTLEGARLTELHRVLQVKLSTQAMAATRLLWSTLDPTDLDKARDTWLRQQLQLMKVYDQKSALAAADYMKKFRVVEGFPAGPIEAVDGFDADWAESSLGYNGPGAIGAATAQGVLPEVAKQQALSRFLAASQRVALGGGRRVMDQSSLANPDSNGWRRVSDGNPCSFCAMLVSRGNAYRSPRSAGQGRHWHRRCGCSVEEVFGDWTPTAREQRYVDAYDSAAAHLDSEGKAHTQGNILGHMREHGSFNDSPTPKVKPEPKLPTINLDEPSKPVSRKLTGSFTPKPAEPPPLGKTQLAGSFAPKAPEKTQLTGSFAPKAPPPIVKTQLSGSFTPKKPEKVQLAGSFAPKAAAPVKATEVQPMKPKLMTLADFKVAAKAPPKLPVKPVEVPTPPPTPKPTKATPKPKPPKPTPAAVNERVAELTAVDNRRRFKSANEGMEWAADRWPGVDGYSSTQLAAIRKYTDADYSEINGKLRNTGGAKGALGGLDSAIRKAPRVPEDIVVARDTSPLQFGITGKGDLSSLTGKTFTEHGYLSTSVDSAGYNDRAPVRMHISVPKGHKAIYVSGRPGDPERDILSTAGGSEAELILDRGAQYRVTGVRKVGKRWHVDVDLIGSR